MASTSDPFTVFAYALRFFVHCETKIETKRGKWGLIYPFKPSSTSCTHHVLMCKLDNKIRTCLLALYGTYQHDNLIPASLFPGPRFNAFFLDSIAFLFNEAATRGRGMVGVGLCIIAENTKQGPTAVIYEGTKGPLCQHIERVRGQGIAPQQRSSQRGLSATGKTDPNRQRWNGDSSFQHRYTVSEQVHWLAADRLSKLPHTKLPAIPQSSWAWSNTR